MVQKVDKFVVIGRGKIARWLTLGAYVVLGLVGALLSSHIFSEYKIDWDFLIFYTNLTNYFCIVVVLIMLCTEIKSAFCYKICQTEKDFLQNVTHNGSDNSSRLSNLKFVAGLLIFITFAIFNFLLADFSVERYWCNLYNLLFHIILPLWFLQIMFEDCQNVSAFAPLIAVGAQVGYVMLVLLRAKLFALGNNRVVYPYFFLNFETLGLAGSIKWVAIMLAVTLCFGYLFWLIIYLKNATNRANATSKLKSFYAKINRQN